MYNSKSIKEYIERSEKFLDIVRNNMTIGEKMRGLVLDEAKNVINGDRQDMYGNPEDSFKLIAKYWSTYLEVDITARDATLMMVLFKLAREKNQHKRDNIVDAAGYLGILGDMESNEEIYKETHTSINDSDAVLCIHCKWYPTLCPRFAEEKLPNYHHICKSYVRKEQELDSMAKKGKE